MEERLTPIMYSVLGSRSLPGSWQPSYFSDLDAEKKTLVVFIYPCPYGYRGKKGREREDYPMQSFESSTWEGRVYPRVRHRSPGLANCQPHTAGGDALGQASPSLSPPPRVSNSSWASSNPAKKDNTSACPH